MTEGSAGRGAPVPVPKVRPGRPYPRYAVISVTAVTNTTLLKAKLRTCAFRNSLPSAGSKYVQGSAENPRFNLHAFWVDQKKQLPMHYGVYLTQVGCIRSAAASVETVFSGAGKFMDEAPGTGAKLLRGIVLTVLQCSARNGFCEQISEHHRAGHVLEHDHLSRNQVAQKLSRA